MADKSPTRTGARRFESKALDLPMVPEYDRAAIKALRERFEISQATLAMVLNTSLSTVKQWEMGAKRPSGTSAKLLDVLGRKGLDALS